MGILTSIKYTEFNSVIGAYPQEVEMDLSFMRIRVSNLRIMNDQSLVFISSPHYSEGHLFNFDMISSGWTFTVRRLEGINNEHLLDKKGVFTRKGFNKIYFHYFTGSDPRNPVLSYSLNINFLKAYISLKSKTVEKGISEITITANDGSNMDKEDIPEPVKIKV